MQNKVTGERMRNETERMHFTQTRLSEYADGTFRIPECGVPQVYEVHVEIEGSSIENSYEIYAFPKCHSKLGGCCEHTASEGGYAAGHHRSV